MAFSKALKDKVLEKAGYCCCMCGYAQGIRAVVEVHHLIPQAEKEDDTEANAAPLCPSHHAEYGNNPDLRKSIRDRRDYLYQQVAERPIAHAGTIEVIRQIRCPDCGTQFFASSDGFALVEREKTAKRFMEDWKNWKEDESTRVGKEMSVITNEMHSRGIFMSGIHHQRTGECMAEHEKKVARQKVVFVRKLEDMGYSQEEIDKLIIA